MPACLAGWHVMIYNGGTFNKKMLERSTGLPFVVMTYLLQGIYYDHTLTSGTSRI
jgi:hypothetical protein